MRRKRRILRQLILILLLAAAVGLAAAYLAPLLSPAEVATYAAYTVQRGDISTDKSFSAAISVLYSETHQNTSRAGAIREIYVERGQEVQKGDKLMLLDNGEVLRAGLDGVVTEMNYDTTDMLRSNAQLIQICDLTNLEVSLSIDEYDVRNIAAGQKCIVTIVPLGEDYEAEITHVDRVSASSGQVAFYTATAKITVPSHVLPGMTASVTMPDESAENVLLLDMAALAFDDEKQPYVLRKDGEDYIHVPVTTGLSDGTRVEIVSGLQEGETVWAVSGTETVENGFSIGKLYKQLVGEKIVIRNMDGGNSRNQSFGSGATDRFPAGFPQGVTPGGAQGVMPGGAQGVTSGGAQGVMPGRSQSGTQDESQDESQSGTQDESQDGAQSGTQNPAASGRPQFQQGSGNPSGMSRNQSGIATGTDFPGQQNRERKDPQ